MKNEDKYIAALFAVPGGLVSIALGVLAVQAWARVPGLVSIRLPSRAGGQVLGMVPALPVAIVTSVVAVAGIVWAIMACGLPRRAAALAAAVPVGYLLLVAPVLLMVVTANPESAAAAITSSVVGAFAAGAFTWMVAVSPRGPHSEKERQERLRRRREQRAERKMRG